MPNNPLQNLPQGWEVKTLGEIFLIERGGSPRPIKEYLTTDSDGINWIKIGDTKNITKYITETAQKIKPEGKKYSRFVEIGDLILSNSMSFGKPYIMKTTGCIHDGWVVFKQDKKVIDEEFCYYILSSSEIYAQFDKLATGSTVKNLNIERIKQIRIPLPPLQTQQKIVAKLESEFAKIEAAKSHLEKVKETIPRLKNSLLKSAFSGELTQPCKDERGLPYRHCEDSSESKAHNPQGFCPHSQICNAEVPQDSIVESKVCRIVDCHELHCNSRNDESIAQAPNFTRAPNLGGATSVAQNLQSDTNPPNYHLECNEREESRIVDSHRDISYFSNTQYDKKDNLPQGWEMKTLGEVCESISAGGDKPKNATEIRTQENKIPIYANGIFNDGLLGYTNMATILKPAVTISARGTIGFVRIRYEAYFPIVRLISAIPNESILKLEFLKYALEFFIPKGEGSSIPQLTIPAFKKISIPLPPIEIQKQIVEILDSKFAALENLKKETNASLENLQRLKSSLLNLAFKGELV